MESYFSLLAVQSVSLGVVASLREDAANTLGAVLLRERYACEAHFTPIFAPRVFENQVIAAVRGVGVAVADGEHGVAHMCAASLPVDYAAVVILEES